VTAGLRAVPGDSQRWVVAAGPGTAGMGRGRPRLGCPECSVGPPFRGLGPLGVGQVARAQVRSTRVRPRPRRLRRFSAAVRHLSQALFLVVPW
jgi:hypothetical protein